MSIQIGCVISTTIDLITKVGRVKQNGSGYACNSSFASSRQDKSHGGSISSPAIFNSQWRTQKIQEIDSISGITQNQVVWPFDCNLNEFNQFPSGGNISETYAFDNLSRQFISMDNSLDTQGQNVSYLSAISGNSSSSSSPITTSSNRCLFVGKTYFEKNQAFNFRELRFSSYGTNLQPIQTVIDQPDSNLKNNIPLNINNNFSTTDILTLISESTTVLYFGLLNALDKNRFCLIIPETAPFGCFLLQSEDFGNSYDVIDSYPLRSEIIGLTNSGEYENNITISLVNGELKIQFANSPEPWIFRKDNLYFPAGFVGVFYSGSKGIWNISPLNYTINPSDTVISISAQNWNYLPNYINSDPTAVTTKLFPVPSEVSSITATPSILTGKEIVALGLLPTSSSKNSDQWYARIIVMNQDSSGNPAIVPTINYFQEIRNAAIELISIPQGDLAADITELTINQTRRRRGTTCKININNFQGQWSFLRSGMFLSISMSQIISDDSNPGNVKNDPPAPVFTGLIRKLQRNETSLFANTGTISLELIDIEYFLSLESMDSMPIFAGWNLAEAMNYICNRAGLENSYYDWSTLSEVTLEGGPTTFQYLSSTKMLKAMDEMLASQGYLWEIDENSIIKPFKIGQYDTSYSYILTDKNYDSGIDCLRSLDVSETLDNTANYFVMDSKQNNGTKTVRLFDNSSAYGDTSSPEYIGKQIWDYSHAIPGLDPTNLLLSRAYHMSASRRLIEWTTDLNLKIKPRQLVTLNLTFDMGAISTSMEVVERTISIKMGEVFEGTCTFILAGV